MLFYNTSKSITPKRMLVKRNNPGRKCKIITLISYEKLLITTPIAKLSNSKSSKNNQSSPINKNDIEMKETKVTKKSKDAIIYCMFLFDDYITTCSCNFIFLMLKCNNFMFI